MGKDRRSVLTCPRCKNDDIGEFYVISRQYQQPAHTGSIVTDRDLCMKCQSVLKVTWRKREEGQTMELLSVSTIADCEAAGGIEA